MYSTSRILILVDVQNGFCTSENVEQLERLKRLCKSTHVHGIIATQFVNRQGSLFERALDWHAMMSGSDVELVDGLRDIADIVVQKSSYSCSGEDLLTALRHVYRHIVFEDGEENLLPDEVLVAGCDTEACVYATAIGLFDCGVLPIVVEDCCWSSGGKKMHDAGIMIMRRTLGDEQVVLSSEL
jgi:nicotinamidase-related amidase